jgi:hypothetical protein
MFGTGKRALLITRTKCTIRPRKFIRETAGPSGLVGVFEDDGETGYLYIYEPAEGVVLRHLRIYNRSLAVDVQEGDVEVEWSADLTKCGVRIWNKLRGIIDIARGLEGRVLVENRQTPGISDEQWLSGFDFC